MKVNDDNAALFDAAQAVQGTDAQLSSISQLMIEEAQLAGELETVESVAADFKERLNDIRLKRLPEAMQAAGVDKFRCADTGTEARLAFECSGSLGTDEAERERKIDLLIGSGAEEIVKTEVRAAFQKGELEKAKALAGELSRRGIAATVGRTIHPMTLKSWVKERMEAGDELPLNDVGLWYGQVAKIKRPK